MISKVLCSAYIFFVVGITAIPAILGYTAGIDDRQK